jgi:hypothetical protein
MEYLPVNPYDEAAVQKDLDWMACKEEAMFVVSGIFTTREKAEIINAVICVSEAFCVSSAGGFFIGFHAAASASMAFIQSLT